MHIHDLLQARESHVYLLYFSEYNNRKFVPNQQAIDDLNRDVRKKAVDEANHLFDD